MDRALDDDRAGHVREDLSHHDVDRVLAPEACGLDIQTFALGESGRADRACDVRAEDDRNQALDLVFQSPIRRLQQIMEEACRRIGLTKVVSVRDPETGAIHQKIRQKHSVHDLRHTAAVLIYQAEKAAGSSEPWMKVKHQLGHSHVHTTINTYLHHVEIFGEKQRFLDIRKMIGLP